jgi:hypothetical protein
MPGPQGHLQRIEAPASASPPMLDLRTVPVRPGRTSQGAVYSTRRSGERLSGGLGVWKSGSLEGRNRTECVGPATLIALRETLACVAARARWAHSGDSGDGRTVTVTVTFIRQPLALGSGRRQQTNCGQPVKRPRSILLTAYLLSSSRSRGSHSLGWSARDGTAHRSVQPGSKPASEGNARE